MAIYTILVTSPPYSAEKAWTAFRFAITALLDGHDVNIFLIESGVFNAKKEHYL